MKLTAMALVAICFAGTASAAIKDNVTATKYKPREGVDVTIGASTEHVFRGVSMSNEDPVGGINIQYTDKHDWYIGVDAVTSDKEGIADKHFINTYLGYNFNFFHDETAPMFIELEHYNIHNDFVDLNFWEVSTGITQKFQKSSIGADIAYAKDYFGQYGEAVTYSGFAEYNDVDLPFGRLTQDWTLGLRIGASQNKIDDYAYWKAYFGKTFRNGVGIEVAYHDTSNLVVLPTFLVDDRVTATISYSF